MAAPIAALAVSPFQTLAVQFVRADGAEAIPAIKVMIRSASYDHAGGLACQRPTQRRTIVFVSDRSPSLLHGVRALDAHEMTRQVLLCISCGLEVTHDGARIHVAGAHRHAFSNKARSRFSIACFAVAPGCRPVSKMTSEHTWFPGYGWAILCCQQCNTHLGRRFNSGGGGHHFFGLVEARLVRLGHGYRN